MKLSKHIFWDIDMDKIDWDKHMAFVISRVLTRGSLNDWKEINSYYGSKKVKKILLHVRFLDRKNLNFCSYYFNIAKKHFRCYDLMQSGQKHWTY